MPMRYTIDREAGVLRSSAEGTVTDAHILEHKRAVLAELRKSPLKLELVDARGIERVEVTPAGIRAVADLDVEAADLLEGRFRIAIVVDSDISYGLARMYEMQTQAVLPDVSVFRDMDAACAWLGLTPPALPRPRPDAPSRAPRDGSSDPASS